jgi:hypothetical protein
MTVVRISDYAKKAKTNTPLCITFFGPRFARLDGADAGLNITVNVEDGDVLRILRIVQEDGGIGEFRSGQYLYLPWPCACVVMHDPGETPFEIDGGF